jgi:hypothetical protein
MSLRYRYRLQTVNHPVCSLGGRWVRPRPILTVGLIGPTGSQPLDALLDTGSDDTLFPQSLAAPLGLDLTNAPSGSGLGIGTGSVSVRYAEVTLRITDGQEFREWPAWVGFTRATPPLPILGFAGFLQYFTATFRGEREEVELAVNALYPGT